MKYLITSVIGHFKVRTIFMRILFLIFLGLTIGCTNATSIWQMEHYECNKGSCSYNVTPMNEKIKTDHCVANKFDNNQSKLEAFDHSKIVRIGFYVHTGSEYSIRLKRWQSIAKDINGNGSTDEFSKTFHLTLVPYFSVKEDPASSSSVNYPLVPIFTKKPHSHIKQTGVAPACFEIDKAKIGEILPYYPSLSVTPLVEDKEMQGKWIKALENFVEQNPNLNIHETEYQPETTQYVGDLIMDLFNAKNISIFDEILRKNENLSDITAWIVRKENNARNYRRGHKKGITLVTDPAKNSAPLTALSTASKISLNLSPALQKIHAQDTAYLTIECSNGEITHPSKEKYEASCGQKKVSKISLKNFTKSVEVKNRSSISVTASNFGNAKTGKVKGLAYYKIITSNVNIEASRLLIPGALFDAKSGKAKVKFRPKGNHGNQCDIELGVDLLQIVGSAKLTLRAPDASCLSKVYPWPVTWGVTLPKSCHVGVKHNTINCAAYVESLKPQVLPPGWQWTLNFKKIQSLQIKWPLSSNGLQVSDKTRSIKGVCGEATSYKIDSVVYLSGRNKKEISWNTEGTLPTLEKIQWKSDWSLPSKVTLKLKRQGNNPRYKNRTEITWSLSDNKTVDIKVEDVKLAYDIEYDMVQLHLANHFNKADLNYSWFDNENCENPSYEPLGKSDLCTYSMLDTNDDGIISTCTSPKLKDNKIVYRYYPPAVNCNTQEYTLIVVGLSKDLSEDIIIQTKKWIRSSTGAYQFKKKIRLYNFTETSLRKVFSCNDIAQWNNKLETIDSSYSLGGREFDALSAIIRLKPVLNNGKLKKVIYITDSYGLGSPPSSSQDTANGLLSVWEKRKIEFIVLTEQGKCSTWNLSDVSCIPFKQSLGQQLNDILSQ